MKRFTNSNARVLYIFAWAVEIIAVIIGFSISLAIAYDAWQNITAQKEAITSDYINVFIAAMPFVLVAVVEITKIPMAGATYMAKGRGWKWLFGFALLFLAVITWETAYNGFERAFANIRWSIETKMGELQAINEKIDGLEEDNARFGELTPEAIEKIYNERRANSTDSRSAKLKPIEEQIKELKSTSDSGYIDSLRGDLKRLDQDISDKRKKRDHAEQQALKNANAVIEERKQKNEQERQRLRAQITDLENKIGNLREKKHKVTGLFSGGRRKRLEDDEDELKDNLREKENELRRVGNVDYAGVSARVSREIKEYDDAIADLEKSRAEKSKKIALAIESKDKSLQPRLRELEAERKKILVEFDQQIAEYERNRKEDNESLQSNAARMDGIVGDLETEREKRRLLRTKIDAEARTTQIYRITRQFVKDAKSAADLRPDQVNVVATIWFGSLATVIALTGILLALGAYVLEHGVDRPKAASPSPWQKLGGSLRRWVVAKRRAPQREKIVTKTVPREVLVKELVHVPVLVGGEHEVKVKTAQEENVMLEDAEVDLVHAGKSPGKAEG